jgi:hypothetical protein
MAFPTTGVLDDFERPNENPLGNGNWTGPAVGFVNQLKIHLTEGRAIVTDTSAGSYWSANTYGPAFEIWTTLADLPANDYLGWAVSNPGTSGWTGYYIDVNHGLDTVQVRTQSAQIGADITGVAFANGDSIGLEYSGGVLTVYRKPSGGSWGAVGNRSDSTYIASTGNLWLGTSTGSFSEFGGGTLAAGTTRRPSGLLLVGCG